MFETQLNKLQTILQGYFDEGLYSGLTNTQNRVSTGKMSRILTTPHINIEYTQTQPQTYGTSGLTQTDNKFSISFVIQPTNDMFDNLGKPEITQITNKLNAFSNTFISRLYQDYRFGDDTEDWHYLQPDGFSDLKQ